MTLIAAIGFIMVLVLMYCLITKKLLPPVAFILLPVIAALIAGFSITDIGDFATAGIKGMVSTVSLFVFSISFFSLMSEVGVFDATVNKLIKVAGSNITAVMLATAAIAVIGHLDGSGATTFIITITAMAPIYSELNLDKKNLMLITCMAIGVMNMVPWAGPTLRAATVLEMDAADLWHPIIPAQVICLILVFVITYILSKIELRKAKIAITPTSDKIPVADSTVRLVDPSRKGLMLTNYILTIGVIVILMLDRLPAAFTFMMALAIGLIINIRDIKTQSIKLKEYGTAAMSMVVTLFAAGIFTGVLKNTGMLDSMASAIVTIIPSALGPYTHFIIAALSVPLIMCLGTDSFYYGLLPVIIGVSSNFGVPAEIVTRTLIIAENIGVTVSPLTPAVFLGLGLLDLDIGEHIKHSLPWIWGMSIVSVILAVIIGIIPL